jgi:hypothetical protein
LPVGAMVQLSPLSPMQLHTTPFVTRVTAFAMSGS